MNWQPIRTPLSCGCGAKFSVEHAPLRHNEIRDLTANLLTEVCSNISTEPDPITGETLRGATSNSQPGVRLDVAANGFWGGRFQKTYLDVRPFRPSIQPYSLLPQTWETCLRAKDKRNRKCIIHPTRSLCHRRSCSRSDHFLKRPTRNEMASTLLLHPVLATLPPKFLSTKISDPVHSWGPIKRRSSHQDTAPYGSGYVRTPIQLNSAPPT